jgi:hypothetical protein
MGPGDDRRPVGGLRGRRQDRVGQVAGGVDEVGVLVAPISPGGRAAASRREDVVDARVVAGGQLWRGRMQ